MFRRTLLTSTIVLTLSLAARAHAQGNNPMSNATVAPGESKLYQGTPGDYIAKDFSFGTGETLREL